MLVTIFLDPLSAIAYGELFLFLIKWCCIALVIAVLLGGFILFMRRLDRESTQEEPVVPSDARQMRGDDLFLWIMVVVMLIIFFAWIY
jgi:hypothetical protein